MNLKTTTLLITLTISMLLAGCEKKELDITLEQMLRDDSKLTEAKVWCDEKSADRSSSNTCAFVKKAKRTNLAMKECVSGFADRVYGSVAACKEETIKKALNK